jgi:anti-sigma-K factor RskA
MSERLDCHAVDELAAALAVGAVESDEVRAVAEHLATCGEAHEHLRELLGASEILAMSLEPVAPSQGLRERLMTTIERTAQEPTPAPARPVRGAPSSARGWLDWLSPRVARPVALLAMAAVLAVGAWNVTLQSDLARRDRALRDVAAAISGGEVAFRVDGSGGRGYVVETPGTGAALVVADLASLPADRLYELWLLDAEGTPVAVGTFRPGDEPLTVVPLERDLTGFSTFAVTVEAERLDAPSNLDLVMIGDLTSS